MSETENTLRAMSFNIRTSTARDLRFAWDLRKHLVIERIRTFEPDLLGLQECHDAEQAEFIKQQLPDYQFLGIRRGDDSRTGREMAPILYRKDVFELLGGDFFWLSNSPQEPGSKLFGAIFPRTVTWAKLQPRNQERDAIYFFNTHFDYMPLVMSSSAKILRQQILDITGGAPTVVTGDFNTPTGGSTQNILTEPHEQDGHEIFNLSDSGAGQRDDSSVVGTIHKFGRIKRAIIIDWILASNHFDIINADVDDYNHKGIYPSDHYPVTATLV